MTYLRLQAAQVLRAVGIDDCTVGKSVSGLLATMLRRVVTDEDKIAIYERYVAGEVDEELARLLLGADFDALQAERADFPAAMDADTDGMFRA